MAESVNQQIADGLVRQQIQAGRVETTLRREVLEHLAILESDILAALTSADPTQFVLLSRRRREVDALMRQDIDPLVQERYSRIAALLDAALMRLARHEAGAIETIINSTADEQIVEEQPSERQLRAGVVNGIFPSAAKPTDLATVAADWWTRAGESLSQRISDSLTTGVALEENLVDLTRRVRGTAATAFADGLMAKGRSDAQRLLATQTTNAVNESRMAVGDRNPQRLMAVHQSILDSRTSYICLGRNGLRYSLPDHEPINHAIPYLSGPPYHPNCRSIMTIVVRDGGPVAQETTAQWLRRQGAAFQDEVLGPTRAKMFRDDRLSPRDLLAATSGRPLTLEELGA